MSSLPVEVVIEILSWLPLKSLLRFKCVNKTWLHFLSTNANFAKLHLDRSTESNHGLVFASNMLPNLVSLEKTHFFFLQHNSLDQEPLELESPFHDDTPGTHYHLLGSCNGLVCLCKYDYEINLYHGFSFDKDIYIWNPYTKDYITISTTPPVVPSQYSDVKMDWYCEFGFLPATNEYKLVQILTPHSEHMTSIVSVYTLGCEDSWKEVQHVPYRINSCVCNSFNSFLNGAFHFLASRPGLDFGGLIVSFDLRDEVFREMLPPQNDDVVPICYVLDITILELGGLLSLCYQSTRGFHIWVMKEYGVVSSWMKHSVIECSVEDFQLEPICLSTDGELLLNKNGYELVMNNRRHNSIKQLQSFNHVPLQLYPFMRSLISPRMNHGDTISNMVEQKQKKSRGNDEEGPPMLELSCSFDQMHA